ncbi:MAG: helix-turn-helix transcriptional regulator [Deltaproteobacteria bacterium]|nr:helix-turn-helix transcriptional regulator [Deltaproteobacteria bacterium]
MSDNRTSWKESLLAADVSAVFIAKRGKDDDITTDALLKICNIPNCDIADIMEIEREQIGVTDGGRTK